MIEQKRENQYKNKKEPCTGEKCTTEMCKKCHSSVKCPVSKTHDNKDINNNN